jgi:hypothetical protein
MFKPPKYVILILLSRRFNGLSRTSFAAWLGGDEPDVESINAVTNCIGVAFGQRLVDAAGWIG